MVHQDHYHTRAHIRIFTNMFTSVRYTLQHKLLRGCKLAGRNEFSIHSESVLWSPTDCSRWPERQCWNLHLRSSVIVLRMAASPRSAEWRPARRQRFAAGMQTCWKYAGPFVQHGYQFLLQTHEHMKPLPEVSNMIRIASSTSTLM